MTAPTLQRRDFADGATLAPAFAEWTAQLLQQAVDERGEALLIVSGGTTPKRYFRSARLRANRLGAGRHHARRRALRAPTTTRAPMQG